MTGHVTLFFCKLLDAPSRETAVDDLYIFYIFSSGLNLSS